jgi:hypothetical protein
MLEIIKIKNQSLKIGDPWTKVDSLLKIDNV